jgi:hypothetical protein
MLTIFRRHLKACPQHSRRYRRCQCPIWIEGTLGLEDVPRRSLNLTSWDAAEEYVRESNRTGKVGGTSAKPMLIAEAVELYLTDVESRVRVSTVRLHRVLLRDSLLVWCGDKGYRYLSELDVKALIEYRSSWQFAPLTALKKFERLRSFFRFCHAAMFRKACTTRRSYQRTVAPGLIKNAAYPGSVQSDIGNRLATSGLSRRSSPVRVPPAPNLRLWMPWR